MTQIEVLECPPLDGKRRALVLTEDRVGHYPEFRQFFVRRFDLDSTGLARPGDVRTQSGMVYALVFIGRSGEPFPEGIEIYALPDALEPLNEADLDADGKAVSVGRDRDRIAELRRSHAFSDHSAASALNSSASCRITPDSGSNWPTQGSRASTALVWA